MQDQVGPSPSHATFRPERAHRLNDVRRLETQVAEADLARLLALKGNENLLDLGSGTGFYTDRMARLTTGVVYAVDFQPEMHAHHRTRGLPVNVQQLSADLTDLVDLTIIPRSVDVACTITTWHEIGGRLDLPGLLRVLSPGGRLVVIDWRKHPESWDHGPPGDIRFTKEEVASSLQRYFAHVDAEDLGRFMFAVVARRIA